jgi:hypothetical protein
MYESRKGLSNVIVDSDWHPSKEHSSSSRTDDGTQNNDSDEHPANAATPMCESLELEPNVTIESDRQYLKAWAPRVSTVAQRLAEMQIDASGEQSKNADEPIAEG